MPESCLKTGQYSVEKAVENVDNFLMNLNEIHVMLREKEFGLFEKIQIIRTLFLHSRIYK